MRRGVRKPQRRIVLSNAGQAETEVVWNEWTECFIRFRENAFLFIDGVTQRVFQPTNESRCKLGKPTPRALKPSTRNCGFVEGRYYPKSLCRIPPISHLSASSRRLKRPSRCRSDFQIAVPGISNRHFSTNFGPPATPYHIKVLDVIVYGIFTSK